MLLSMPAMHQAGLKCSFHRKHRWLCGFCRMHYCLGGNLYDKIFDAQAVVEHFEEGPVMYVLTWYLRP